MDLGWYVAHSYEKSLPLQVWRKSLLLYSLSDSGMATAFFIFFCDKSFKFAIQIWQTSLEH